MRGISRDFTFAWRRLRATPLFTTFAILTLTLGIGVTTGIYSAVRAVLTPPSGVGEVDRLVRVTRTAGGSGPTQSLSWPEYQDLLSQQSVFDSIAAWDWIRAAVSAGNRTEQLSAEVVSGSYFETLGVTAARGRTLNRSDDDQTAPPVAVISHRVWERWFESSPDVIGRPIKVNGTSLAIVGVVDPEFSGLFNGGVVSTAVWTTFSTARSLAGLEGVSFDPANRGRRWISVTARLAPGRHFEEASAQVAAIGARLNEAYPEQRDARSAQGGRPWVARRISDVPKVLGADRVIGPMTTALMTAVLLVLLVACTNLANLMLARTSGRGQELAVRMSLGASRWRVLRETLAETILLAGVGGFLAVGVARLLMVVLGGELVISRGLAVQMTPRLDPAVLGAAMLATFLAMLIAGLAPALFAARADIRRALASGSLGAASPRWRGRRYLIAVQVAVSVVLVTMAGLCVAQVRDHQRRDAGVEFDRLALVDVDFRQPQYDQGHVRDIVSSVLQRVSAQPGVQSASMSSGLPSGIGTPGAEVVGPAGVEFAELVAATPRILETLGVELRRGRGLDERDVAGAQPVAILGERTAAMLFGTSSALGQTLTVRRRSWVGEPDWPSRDVTIVGIVESSGRELGVEPGAVIFVPLAQQFEDRLVLAVRSTGEPGALVNTLRQIVQSTAPEAPITQSLTGTALQAQDTLFFQVVAIIATVLGGMALAVALAGLYGILSFIVAGRTREIGIRIAVGASDRGIRRQILREGLSPVVLGLVFGLGIGALVRLGMQPLFQRMLPSVDLAVLVLVPLLFIAAGLLACYLPARRASRVNPIVALRQL